MTAPRTDGMWLFVGAAARAAGVSEEALRRRIERETVMSEVRGGRRLVLVERGPSSGHDGLLGGLLACIDRRPGG